MSATTWHFFPNIFDKSLVQSQDAEPMEKRLLAIFLAPFPMQSLYLCFWVFFLASFLSFFSSCFKIFCCFSIAFLSQCIFALSSCFRPALFCFCKLYLNMNFTCSIALFFRVLILHWHTFFLFLHTFFLMEKFCKDFLLVPPWISSCEQDEFFNKELFVRGSCKGVGLRYFPASWNFPWITLRFFTTHVCDWRFFKSLPLWIEIWKGHVESLFSTSPLPQPAFYKGGNSVWFFIQLLFLSSALL